MGWVEDLYGSVVYLDTAPFILSIEDHPIYAGMLDAFFEAVENRKIFVVTSIVTLLEVLVHPIRDNNVELAQQYQTVLFKSIGFSVVK